MSALRRALLRLLSSFRADHTDAELAREIGAHLRQLEDKFLAQGLSPDEARHAARRAFGGVEQVKAGHRDARSFRWIDHSWLDFQLGVRMLIKYPGLTLVGGLGIAVAIAIAVGAASIVDRLLDPTLPLDDGARVIAIQNRDRSANKAARGIVRDFLTWRDELRSVQDVSAFRSVSRNLIAPGGQPEPVRVAEISASGFRMARVPAALGRYLLDDDARAGAAPVLVIGDDEWRDRFGSDPAIVGRRVQLGDTTYAIVGVMPAAFRFPINDGFWVPLRTDAASDDRETGPQVFTVGRLAPGATIERAQAELTAVGQRLADAFPDTHGHLRPRVLPYTYQFSDMDDVENVLALQLIRLLVTLLLVLISVNVAILVYARTAARHAEIAVRGALGASRLRIVGQLFMEALVLAGAAAAAGVALVALALRPLEAAILPLAGRLPFWLEFRLSARAVIYALAFTVLTAAIVGVVPAFKATGRRVQTRLQGLSLGGGASMRLGRTWTMLIVTQVAFAVALLPAAVFHGWNTTLAGIADPGATAREFLTATLVQDRTDLPAASGDAREQELTARYAAGHAELLRRLKAEPGFADVTFALTVPGEERTVWVEVEGIALPPETYAHASRYAVRTGTYGHEARFNRVDVGFFDAFDFPVLMGRVFDASDARDEASAVVVNRSFAQRLAGGGDVLGRRVRYVGRSGDARLEHVELGRWYEIVGVVGDLPGSARASAPTVGLVTAKLYHAAPPGQLQPATLAARVREDARATAAGRLRTIAAAVDPNLQLRDVAMMDDVLRREQGVMRLVAAALGFVTLSVVLLSAAGIYSMMSFTVTQRRREIGIRAALGADPRRLLGSLFSRALRQLATGAALGIAAAALLERAAGGDLMEGHGAIVLPIVVAFMIVVGVLATLGPARRGLRIDPTEALKTEA